MVLVWYLHSAESASCQNIAGLGAGRPQRGKVWRGVIPLDTKNVAYKWHFSYVLKIIDVTASRGLKLDKADRGT